MIFKCEKIENNFSYKVLLLLHRSLKNHTTNSTHVSPLVLITIPKVETPAPIFRVILSRPLPPLSHDIAPQGK